MSTAADSVTTVAAMVTRFAGASAESRLCHGVQATPTMNNSGYVPTLANIWNTASAPSCNRRVTAQPSFIATATTSITTGAGSFHS